MSGTSMQKAKTCEFMRCNSSAISAGWAPSAVAVHGVAGVKGKLGTGLVGVVAVAGVMPKASLARAAVGNKGKFAC